MFFRPNRAQNADTFRHGSPSARNGTGVSRRRRLVIGAELDGSTLRMLRLDGLRVVTYETMEGVSVGMAAEAVKRALGRGDRAVLSWASPGSLVRRTTLLDPSPRRAVDSVRGVLEQHVPGGGNLAGAGAVRPRSDSSGFVGTVGAIVADEGAALAGPLSRTGTACTVSPLTLTVDGMYLAIRSSCVELTLVRDGAAVASRQLRCGGLANGAADDPSVSAVGADVLYNVAYGTTNEPGAAAVARRYVATIVREVHRTVENWKRSGEECPDSVWVFGPGATLPHLPSFLDSVGLTAVPAPVQADVDVSVLPVSERLSAFGALSAALVDLHGQPLLHLGEAKRGNAHRSRRRASADDPFAGFEGVITGSGDRGFKSPSSDRARETETPAGLGIVVLVAVIATVCGLLAWWTSTRALDSASDRLASAVASRKLANTSLDYVGKVQIAAGEVRRLTPTASPGWDASITNLLSALPSAPAVQSMQFAVRGDHLRVTIRVPQAFGVAETWQERLLSAGTIASITEETVGSAKVAVIVVDLFPITLPVVNS